MTDSIIGDFELPSTGEKIFRLSDYQNRVVVIYFYPKDSTPGCTTEAQQFRDLYPAFVRVGCEVVGVSRDSVRSHSKFKTKLGLPFDLLSDTDERLCTQFSVIKVKSMYGKQVRGIERSTFVIDGGRVLRREWRKVKPEGHAREVLEFVKSL